MTRAALALPMAISIALGGCGGEAHSIDGVAHMQIASHHGERLVESGKLDGALDTSLTLDIDLANGNMSFHAQNHDGRFEGSARVIAYQSSGEVRHFEEIGSTTAGTGAFAHVHSGPLTFKTVDDRIHHRITVTVTGTLDY